MQKNYKVDDFIIDFEAKYNKVAKKDEASWE